MFKTIEPFSAEELIALLKIVAPHYTEIKIEYDSRDFEETTDRLPTGFTSYTYLKHLLRGPLHIKQVSEFIVSLPENKYIKTITVSSISKITEINVQGRTIEVYKGENPFTPEDKEALDIHKLTHIL